MCACDHGTYNCRRVGIASVANAVGRAVVASTAAVAVAASSAADDDDLTRPSPNLPEQEAGWRVTGGCRKKPLRDRRSTSAVNESIVFRILIQYVHCACKKILFFKNRFLSPRNDSVVYLLRWHVVQLTDR